MFFLPKQHLQGFDSKIDPLVYWKGLWPCKSHCDYGCVLKPWVIPLKTEPIWGPSKIRIAITTMATKNRIKAYSTKPWPSSSLFFLRSFLKSTIVNSPLWIIWTSFKIVKTSYNYVNTGGKYRTFNSRHLVPLASYCLIADEQADKRNCYLKNFACSIFFKEPSGLVFDILLWMCRLYLSLYLAHCKEFELPLQ